MLGTSALGASSFDELGLTEPANPTAVIGFPAFGEAPFADLGQPPGLLDAVASGGVTTSAVLSTEIRLGASPTAQTNQVLAMLNTGIPLVGASTAAATVAAQVSTAIRLNATVVAATLVTGAELAAQIRFVTSTTVVVTTSSPELVTAIRLAASVSALTTASPDLTAYSTRRPASDIITTGWTPSTGTSLFAVVDEEEFSDADYASSPALGFGPASATFGLTGSIPPENLVVRVRARGKSGYEQIRAVLLDEGNAVLGASAWHALGTTFQQHNLQIYTAQTSSRVRIETRGN